MAHDVDGRRSHLVAEPAPDADVRPRSGGPGGRLLPGRLPGARHRGHVVPAVLRREPGAPGERHARLGHVLDANQVIAKTRGPRGVGPSVFPDRPTLLVTRRTR